MNKIKKLLALLVVSPLFLGSCVRNNGYCYCDEKTVKDEDDDGICDICGLPIAGFCHHEDKDEDGYCDICGHDMNAPEGGDDDSGSGGSGGGDQGGGSGGDQGGGGGSGGGGSGGGGGNTPVDPPVDPNVPVTTYLVLTQYGLLDGQPGTLIPDKFLEYASAFVGLPGAALPDATRVTHSHQNCDFVGWLCYEGTGAPTVYTTVPYAADKVLYASFEPNDNPEVNPDPIPDPTPPSVDKTTYYLNTDFSNGTDTWNKDGAQMWAYVWNSTDTPAYKMSVHSGNVYKVEIPNNTYNHIIFCRVMPGTVLFNWDSVWNQTVDMDFVAGKTTAQIEGWSGGKICNAHWVSQKGGTICTLKN